MDSKAALLVMGPRRSGKTVLLRALMRELVEGGSVGVEQLLYLNLDDYRLAGNYSLELLEAVFNTYRERVNPEQKVYFFLDEIQNVPEFERYVRTLYDWPEPIKFVLTGSNSQLLTPELATKLTGRTLTFRVLPFSFPEYLAHQGHEPEQWHDRDYYALRRHPWLLHLFERYLFAGGLPEFLDEATPADRLRDYFATVLYRDLLQRSQFRNANLVEQLGHYLASNLARPVAVYKLARTLGCSVNTLREYMGGLERAYLFFLVRGFSFSVKKQLVSPPKVYCIDNGLARVVGFAHSEDRGPLLENLVAIELKRRGHDFYYHRAADRKSECDFVLRRGYQVGAALQVCEELGQPDTRRREIAGLVEALKAYELQEGLILTRNHYETLEVEGCTIRIRPVWYWLLKDPSSPDASSTLPSPPGHEPLAASP